MTPEQLTAISEYINANELFVSLLALFIFVSVVFGFWKGIGKLFKKKDTIPHIPLKEEVLQSHNGELSSSKDSLKTREPEGSRILSFPQEPVELNEEGYLDLTKWVK